MAPGYMLGGRSSQYTGRYEPQPYGWYSGVLTLRLKELGAENRDLREICSENGIQYAERLAARRHKRYFADLCAKHPLGRTATASDVLGAANIVRGIAECAGSVLRTGLIARCFFAAFTHLTAQRGGSAAA